MDQCAEAAVSRDGRASPGGRYERQCKGRRAWAFVFRWWQVGKKSEDGAQYSMLHVGSGAAELRAPPEFGPRRAPLAPRRCLSLPLERGGATIL